MGSLHLYPLKDIIEGESALLSKALFYKDTDSSQSLCARQ